VSAVRRSSGTSTPWTNHLSRLLEAKALADRENRVDRRCHVAAVLERGLSLHRGAGIRRLLEDALKRTPQAGRIDPVELVRAPEGARGL